MALPVRSVISGSIFLGDCCHARLYSFAAPSVLYRRTQYKASTTKMASTNAQGRPKTIDSHLHIWASPQEAADKYPYFPGQEPTLPGHLDFLLQCMEEASVEGALIVQPINHKFDHSLVTSVLKKHPTKFVGCCLANPAENGTGVKQLEDLILKDGYRAVRFNPYLWPSGQQMTNEVGKAMFSRAGELGVPVGFMCMKGLNLHISEITELCTEFPSTAVLLDHLAFCKPPLNDEEKLAFSELLKLSRFPQQFRHHEDAMAMAKIFESKQWWREHQISSIFKNMTLLFLGIEQWSLQLKALHSSIDHKVYVKFSALFRVSRMSSPYLDLVPLLAEIVSNFGANRVMWGSDFPYVVPESGYKGAKEAACLIASQASLSSSEVEWIMGKTVMQLFQGQWLP